MFMLVRTLEPEKEEHDIIQKAELEPLKDDIRRSEQKYRAQECQNARRLKDIDALKDKLPAYDNETTPKTVQQPPKRTPGGANALEDKTKCPNTVTISQTRPTERS